MFIIMYRSWSTPPRGMLLAVLSLMYIIMALNIVMFALVPDYTMFGNQHFQHNITGKEKGPPPLAVSTSRSYEGKI